MERASDSVGRQPAGITHRCLPLPSSFLLLPLRLLPDKDS